jgi:hypothetical protein
MAVPQGHLLAVGGIAVVALGAGFGIARATGGSGAPKPASQTQQASLPPAPRAADARITSLGAAASLPAPKSGRKKTSSSRGGGKGGAAPVVPNNRPSSTPASSAPSTTVAPPVSNPVRPQQTTQPPARTPVVGGGSGGEVP